MPALSTVQIFELSISVLPSREVKLMYVLNVVSPELDAVL